MQEELKTICQQLKMINDKMDLLIQANENRTEGNNKTLNAEQAAEYLHLSLSRIYCLVCDGKLKPLQRKKYGRILFTKEGLNEYLQENKQVSLTI